MISFKTFKVWQSIDSSWTGGRAATNNDSLHQIDEQINNYAAENNLIVDKVGYSFVNYNEQHGSSPNNVQKDIYLMAAVSFKDKNEH